VAQLIVTFAGILTLGIGAVLVINESLSNGALVAIMAIVWRVLTPIHVVLLSWHRLRQLQATLKQINTLMTMKLERDAGRETGYDRGFEGAISVTNAAFRYNNRPEAALKNITLSLAPKEFVVITGPNGAGKSTLLKIILGLYSLNAGMVRLDGLDLRQLDPGEIRRATAYVGQDSALFYGTIAQNLRFAAPGSSHADMLRALGLMGIHFPHPDFPEGLETRLKPERKDFLPPPLQQRLVLARAFLSQYTIALLDEPATHLDQAGDEALMAYLSSMRGKATIVMVTTRPSHMRLADRVIYLEEGAVLGEGPPDTMIPAILARVRKQAPDQQAA
jgi:ABC-type bacteriocin/lantibiotic exporter with double-glycine peptidase domain